MKVPGHHHIAHGLPGPLVGVFAGTEIKAAVTVAQFGEQARCATVLPACHPVADAAVCELRALGVETTGIRRVLQTRPRGYCDESGATQRTNGVTYGRAGSAYALSEPQSNAWEQLPAITAGVGPAMASCVI